MTLILRNSQGDIYYFDDEDELFDWVNENVENSQDWEMIDAEGSTFHI